MTPPTSALHFGETHVLVNVTGDESGSSFNKLQVNDTFGDQERPCHGLHRNPSRVRFNVKLHEDLVMPKTEDIYVSVQLTERN